jgi:hypothetical protein
VISPLLANPYLNSRDHGVNDHPEFGAKLGRYADDFVLLCRPGSGAALYERLKVYLLGKGLRLNDTKSMSSPARDLDAGIGSVVEFEGDFRVG